MEKLRSKKAAVDLTEMAIGLIILGIVVSIGAYMLTTYRDSRLTDLTVATATNESVNFTSAGVNLANTWGKAVTLVNNVSGVPGDLTSTNYTVTIDPVFGTMKIIPVAGTLYENNTIQVTYTYYNISSRQDWTLAGDASTGLLEYGNWFKIIVIVGVAAVVLSLIFMAFGNRNSGSGQAY